MEQIKHFTDLEVWRKAHQLFLDILSGVDNFPNSLGAIVAEQVIRASGSISANIAEGFNRSKKSFVNCLDISIGEANETENWLYKVRDAEFLGSESAVELVKETIRIEKMLVSLKNKIDANPNAVREIPETYDS